MREPRLAESTPVNGEALSRQVLVALRTRALRRGVWYRVLSRIERGLVDLTIRWADRVRSGRLARVLVEILQKLVQALESRMVRVLERGREAAFRLSECARAWGNGEAYGWRFDRPFQEALGLRVVSAG
ncbi:MAG TPA: hypothetical protein VIH83_02125 [Candidatus Bathyarchaeia archaeon]